jgi:transcription elongation GreA/GreB family factor
MNLGLASHPAACLSGRMDKPRLLAAIIEKLTAELEVITRAALMARDEATHEESKPENQYDMHAQEAAYLAEGQARLAAELNENLSIFRNLSVPAWSPGQPAGLGTVVTLDYKGKLSRYFLGPRNGGLEVSLDDEIFTLVTPNSPLGRQLLGIQIGATALLPGRGGQVPHTVVAIE